MNRESKIESFFQTIRSESFGSSALITHFREFLSSEDDYSLFRVNPYIYANDSGFPYHEVLDVFLHASKHGLFVMEWLLVCPRCGDPVKHFQNLIHVHNQYHCDFCRRDYHTSLDDSIHIVFTIHPDIRDIVFHHPESLPIEDYQYKYHFSREGRVPGSSMTFRHFFKKRERFLRFLSPKEVREVEINVREGYLEGNDFLHDTDFLLEVLAERSSKTDEVQITYENQTLHSDTKQCRSGILKLNIKNNSSEKVPLSIYQLDSDFLTSTFLLEFDPHLSAKELLNHRTFRTLFQGEDIVGPRGLSIKDQTFLFTDLKGSTNLYERIGDLKAFSLVQQHFDEMSRVIIKNQGSLVKTIGDAIMATFLSAENAMRAAIEMLEEIETFNKRQLEREIILKIGIHTGASIAVTLNDRLDYFGQVVNIAARVQGLAEGEEICFTNEIYAAPRVSTILRGYPVKSEITQLKGITENIQIYRLSPKEKE
ncbi:adenylate/guanylate cyclase domain-containing protein [Leptospira ryugenii]|uniref:adenylate/guanylate cyclase domain-containing protein n=1 Tax=Leptospira ryugenii TaxID=1917863 RepID=UPI000D5989ED|nr:adenylate/guanylate cyclase domain-containing protein [Leptospira ryugenii]